MAASNKLTTGFSFAGIFIVLGVIVLLAGLGIVGWKAVNPPEEAADAKTSSTTATVEVITTKADLEAAEKALDELDFDDDSAAQAESQANL